MSINQIGKYHYLLKTTCDKTPSSPSLKPDDFCGRRVPNSSHFQWTPDGSRMQKKIQQVAELA